MNLTQLIKKLFKLKYILKNVNKNFSSQKDKIKLTF